MRMFSVGLSNYVALEITCFWHTYLSCNTHIYVVCKFILFTILYLYYFYTCTETHIAFSEFIKKYKRRKVLFKGKKKSPLTENIWLKNLGMEGSSLVGEGDGRHFLASPASGIWYPQLWLCPIRLISRSMSCRSLRSWRPILFYFLSILRCFWNLPPAPILSLFLPLV